MKFSRVWAMPSAETFSIPPIRALLKWRLRDCRVIIDPFARNSRFGTITNDLNPEMSASFHLDAVEFTKGLVKQGVIADAVLFDPPYSPRQIMECYQGVGRAVTMRDTQRGPMFNEVKDHLHRILRPGGLAISCAWNSNGFSNHHGYQIEEILLVWHGGEHNDTIVTVEHKMQAGFDFGAAK